MVSGAMSDAGISTIGGFIKMDRQNVDGTWTDVTQEILNYGIGDTNSVAVNDPDTQCTVGNAPTSPNAIIRLQRLRGNSLNGAAGTCDYVTDTTGAKDRRTGVVLLFGRAKGPARAIPMSPSPLSRPT
jgi:hypothetical protein